MVQIICISYQFSVMVYISRTNANYSYQQKINIIIELLIYYSFLIKGLS